MEFGIRNNLIPKLMLVLKLWNFVDQKPLGVGHLVSFNLIK